MFSEKSRSKLGKGILEILLCSSLAACSGGGSGSNETSQPLQNSNRAPIIRTQSASPLEGDSPLAVSLRYSCSDPEGSDLNYALYLDGFLISGPKSSSLDEEIVIEKIGTSSVKAVCTDPHGAFKDTTYNISVKEQEVKVFSQKEMENVEFFSHENDVIYFSEPVNYGGGTIVVSAPSQEAPNGFLKKVESLSSDKKAAFTTQTTLEEAIGDGGYIASGELSTQGAIVSFENEQLHQSYREDLALRALVSVDDSNNQKLRLSFNDFIIYDFDKNPLTTNDQIRVSGKIIFDPGYRFEIKKEDGRIERLLFELNLNETSELRVEKESYLQDLVLEKEVKIGDIDFSPFIAAYAGIIPIVISPEIGIYVNMHGTLSPLSILVKQEANLSAGLEYTGGQWGTTHNFSNDFDLDLSNSRAQSFETGLDLRMSFLFYGIAGPFVGVGGGFEFKTSFSHLSLYGGLEAQIGMDTGVLSSAIGDFSPRTLIRSNKLLYEVGVEGLENPGSGDDDYDGEIPEDQEIFVDPRDGKSYGIVTIGSQTWMAKNLNYNSSEGDSCYNDLFSNCEIYGRLYDFESSKESCPGGWHLPSESDWDSLFDFLGSSLTAGGKMKSTGTLENGKGLWKEPNSGANNESGFSALPGGLKEDGSYMDKNEEAYFWSDTSPYAFMHSLSYQSSSSGGSLAYGNPEGVSASVRCLKD
ncbi:MAG: fibrobacter succinogenes major paralogous domain-containing protein [Candidatus Pacearchaeota archaeon]